MATSMLWRMGEPTPPDTFARLRRALAAQRRHVLDTVDGLTDEQVQVAALPSGWTFAGLIRHLALDVERFWFRSVLAGEQVELFGGREAWDAQGLGIAEVVELYKAETAAADAALDRADGSTPLAWWPEDLFGPAFYHDALALVMHVLVETATHAGHLDAARELLDRKQHLVVQ